MRTIKYKQLGFFLTESLIASVLSSIVMFGLFSNYILLKEIYIKQKRIATEQENIRVAYMFIGHLFEKSSQVIILGSRSDVLSFRGEDKETQLYVHSTQRKNALSLYIKEADKNAKEVIPGVSKMTVEQNNENKLFIVVLSFEHADVRMLFRSRTHA